MTDSFPRQSARTRGFTLGAPRSFTISPDGGTVIFLRSRSGADPVTCLWATRRRHGRGAARRRPGGPRCGRGGRGGRAADDPIERARRERVRERAGGIVAFATDDAVQAGSVHPCRASSTWRTSRDGTRRRGVRGHRDARPLIRAPLPTPRRSPTSATARCGWRARHRRGPGARGPGAARTASASASRSSSRPRNGPHPRLLVGAGRVGAAGRPRRRDPGASSGTSPTRRTRHARPTTVRYPAAGTANAVVTALRRHRRGKA